MLHLNSSFVYTFLTVSVIDVTVSECLFSQVSIVSQKNPQSSHKAEIEGSIIFPTAAYSSGFCYLIKNLLMELRSEYTIHLSRAAEGTPPPASLVLPPF